MTNEIHFKDFSDAVTDELKDAAIAFLEEAAGELESQVQRNSRVDTGQLKGSWKHRVNESQYTAVVGSELENAIWEEFGTGEFALNGDGRKTPWKYKNIHGKWYKTTGKRPKRAFHKAKISTEGKIKKRAEQIFKGLT